MTLLAKSDGTLLIDHSIKVAKLSYTLAKYIGLEEELCNYCYMAGLFHDIGKCVSYTQNFYKGIELKYEDDFPLHHEISWAFMFLKTKSKEILNAIYWHHPRNILNKNNEFFENNISILSKINQEDLNTMEYFYKEVLLDKSIPNNNIGCDDEIDVPKRLYDKIIENNLGLTNLDNSKHLIIRSCIISADRYVSSKQTDNITEENFVKDIIESNISGEMICPEDYDNNRFKIQNDIIKQIQDNKTSIIKAPAGFGKTLIGVKWALLRKKKILWVCPRNFVAESVFENIKSEIETFNIKCSVELFLTGKRVDVFNNDNEEEFSSDIIVTNIDRLLAPMVNNGIADKLFLSIGSDIIFDEFHELVSDNALFSAFIILMRARHLIIRNSSTLLLSATPMNIDRMWDFDNKTLILPNKNNHYPSAHNRILNIDIVDKIPKIESKMLVKFNSIKNTQKEYMSSSFTHIIHSKYNKIDRKRIQNKILKDFGKKGNGIQEENNLVSAMVVQAALDISFPKAIISFHSPEADTQTGGRIDRWFNKPFNEDTKIYFVKINDKSEKSVINNTYKKELSDLWISHFTDFVNSKNGKISFNEWYDCYNSFYEKYDKEVLHYIKNCYFNGINDSKQGLQEYLPKEFNLKNGKIKNNNGKSLRNATISYNFTLRDIHSNKWLQPSDIDGLSESYRELYDRYEKEKTEKIDNKILKQLSKAGYDEYTERLKKKWNPKNVNEWFKIARCPDTPFPDVTRFYSSEIGIINKEDIELFKF